MTIAVEREEKSFGFWCCEKFIEREREMCLVCGIIGDLNFVFGGADN